MRFNRLAAGKLKMTRSTAPLAESGDRAAEPRPAGALSRVLRRRGRPCLLAAVAVLAAACAGGAPHAPPLSMHHGAVGAAHERPARPAAASPALALEHLSALGDILAALEDKRVVYIGESHDEYAHHLTQLEIIRHLHGVDPQLAIGVEFFQQPFQPALDAYAAGGIDERDMLRATEYFKRWGYDYRLYAPIVRYARDNGLPLIALNASRELVDQVRKSGIDGVEGEDRAALPDGIDRGDTAYEQRLKTIFDLHAHHGGGDFSRFLDVQLLWDESMAQRAADFLREHPRHRLVVLAGSGHLAFGSGIPGRVNRRVPVDSAIVINDWPGAIDPALGDYLLMPDARSLPRAGMMGATLEPGENGGVTVAACMPGSACEAAGLRKGDRLLSLDGVAVADVSEVRALMWDKQPGETVQATILRERRLLGPEERRLALELR
jgi:uncharacterized iron-regulated protein